MRAHTGRAFRKCASEGVDSVYEEREEEEVQDIEMRVGARDFARIRTNE